MMQPANKRPKTKNPRDLFIEAHSGREENLVSVEEIFQRATEWKSVGKTALHGLAEVISDLILEFAALNEEERLRTLLNLFEGRLTLWGNQTFIVQKLELKLEFAHFDTIRISTGFNRAYDRLSSVADVAKRLKTQTWKAESERVDQLWRRIYDLWIVSSYPLK